MTCYSLDIRKKILEAYQQGSTSIRAVAQQFRVSPYTVQRLLNQYRTTGDFRPQKPGSRKKSVLSEHQEVALNVVEDHPDWTLWQYCEVLSEKLGVNISTSMMDRFCHQQGLTQKKSYRSEKVKTPEIQQERVDYWERIGNVALEKLVFIDEAGFWVECSEL
jgi:transposase